MLAEVVAVVVVLSFLLGVLHSRVRISREVQLLVFSLLFSLSLLYLSGLLPLCSAPPDFLESPIVVCNKDVAKSVMAFVYFALLGALFYYVARGFFERTPVSNIFVRYLFTLVVTAGVMVGWFVVFPWSLSPFFLS